jgi:uncharacterized metal-binding protein
MVRMTGREHYIAGIATSILVGMASYLSHGNKSIAYTISVAGIISTTFLDPDLDMAENALINRKYTPSVVKRWGFLKFIWLPYGYLFRHRSVFTHFPFLSDFIRLLYLFVVVFLPIDLALFNLSLTSQLKTLHLKPNEILAVWLGMGSSTAVHYLTDLFTTEFFTDGRPPKPLPHYPRHSDKPISYHRHQDKDHEQSPP